MITIEKKIGRPTWRQAARPARGRRARAVAELQVQVCMTFSVITIDESTSDTDRDGEPGQRHGVDLHVDDPEARYRPGGRTRPVTDEGKRQRDDERRPAAC